jgi:hypothetical protein
MRAMQEAERAEARAVRLQQQAAEAAAAANAAVEQASLAAEAAARIARTAAGPGAPRALSPPRAPPPPRPVVTAVSTPRAAPRLSEASAAAFAARQHARDEAHQARMLAGRAAEAQAAQAAQAAAAHRSSARDDADVESFILSALGPHALPRTADGRADISARSVAAIMAEHAERLHLDSADLSGGAGVLPSALARLFATAASSSDPASAEASARKAKAWLLAAIRRGAFEARLRNAEAKWRARSPSPQRRPATAPQPPPRLPPPRPPPPAASPRRKVQIERIWVANGDRPVAVWQPDAQLETFLARQWRSLPQSNPLRGGSAAALRPVSASARRMTSPPKPKRGEPPAPRFVKPRSPYLPAALLDEWEGDAGAAALAASMRARAEQLRTPHKTAQWAE